MKVGLVAIGRNEGNRLRRCLISAFAGVPYIIYVDSGSTDDSLAIAREIGADIVKLDMTIPFTAARARNSGLKRLIELAPQLQYVQFVDGDCELDPEWIDRASDYLDSRPDISVVCGRRRERFPEHSIYNFLCDIEWDTPIGETNACGGDALMRINAFREVGGFRSNLIAGEEPELCLRMRQKNWKIWRLDAEMTLHDADIRHFSQWWKRSLRAGYAYTENIFIHGWRADNERVRATLGILTWGFLLPFGSLLLSLFNPYFLILLLLYPIQFIRQYIKMNQLSYALFIVLGKFPEFHGQMKCLANRMRGITTEIIEYKKQ